MKTTIDVYRKYMFMYGVLSVLCVLEFFEGCEKYEECQKIVDAIREQSKFLNCELPTRINSEVIADVKKTLRETFNMKGDNVVDNAMYYAELILNEISE